MPPEVYKVLLDPMIWQQSLGFSKDWIATPDLVNARRSQLQEQVKSYISSGVYYHKSSSEGHQYAGNNPF
jgi:hypothetical protein